jgi:general secretion pathway protein G
LLYTLAEYQRQSAQVAVRSTVASLRTALAVEAARVAGSSGQEALAELARQNPMGWLAQAPANYLGEYYRPRADELRRGNWYFDRTDLSINFLRSNDTFSSGTSKLLKFKVELLREPVPTRSGGRRKAIQGVVLVQATEPGLPENH